MRRFGIVQVDVFTKNRLEGNALAVVTDATGLIDEEMQALSKETNLSETTFVFPRDAATEKSRGVRVRIYTVAEEMPFAGHPTLGTALSFAATMEHPRSCSTSTSAPFPSAMRTLPVSRPLAKCGSEIRNSAPVTM